MNRFAVNDRFINNLNGQELIIISIIPRPTRYTYSFTYLGYLAGPVYRVEEESVDEFLMSGHLTMTFSQIQPPPGISVASLNRANKYSKGDFFKDTLYINDTFYVDSSTYDPSLPGYVYEVLVASSLTSPGRVEKVEESYIDMGIKLGGISQINIPPLTVNRIGTTTAKPIKDAAFKPKTDLGHYGHEVVESIALNKKYKYCRACKVEVF
jgi:hypothetical protein